MPKLSLPLPRYDTSGARTKEKDKRTKKGNMKLERSEKRIERRRCRTYAEGGKTKSEQALFGCATSIKPINE